MPIDSSTSPIKGSFIFLIYNLTYKAEPRAQKPVWLLSFEESVPKGIERSVKTFIYLLAETQVSPREVVTQNGIPCDQNSSSASLSVILAPLTSLKVF